MKHFGKLLLVLIIYALLVVGCSTSNTVTVSGQGTPVKNEVTDNQAVTTNGGQTSIAIADIISQYIPKPFNPVLHLDKLEYRGKWVGNVMPGFTQEIEKRGWIEYDGMGAKKFYVKGINGHKVRISIVPTETGGPQEKDATTFVNFELVND